jgi:hypothetical protein
MAAPAGGEEPILQASSPLGGAFRSILHLPVSQAFLGDFVRAQFPLCLHPPKIDLRTQAAAHCVHCRLPGRMPHVEKAVLKEHTTSLAPGRCLRPTPFSRILPCDRLVSRAHQSNRSVLYPTLASACVRISRTNKGVRPPVRLSGPLLTKSMMAIRMAIKTKARNTVHPVRQAAMSRIGLSTMPPDLWN